MNESQKPNLISEHVLEIRYKANPEFLDYRGAFSKAISSLLGLNHWLIDENRADVFNDQKLMRAFVSFNNLGLVLQNSCDKNYFPNQANKLIKYVLSQKPFTNPIFVNRIGVRSRFAFIAESNFQSLLDKYHTKYFVLSDEALKTYNGEIIDAGLFLNIKTDSGIINSQSGPMEKEQLASFFPNSAIDLPDVAFYIDLDYWKEPKKDVTSDTLTKIVKDYSFTSWDQAENIWKLINE